MEILILISRTDNEKTSLFNYLHPKKKKKLHYLTSKLSLSLIFKFIQLWINNRYNPSKNKKIIDIRIGLYILTSNFK